MPATPASGRPRWRAWLIYTHRWLGIAGCLLFLVWFVSGIVLMYARMPEVSADDRLWHAEPLDVSLVQVSPLDAAVHATVRDVVGVRLGVLEGRPVYRFPNLATVFADTGELFNGLTPAVATAVAQRWSPADAATARYDELITSPDQWTLETQRYLPMHRVALGDPAGTAIYVSNRNGEVVMATDRRSRFWAYWGPIAHWLYLPVLRRNGPLWTQVILWSSGLGCVMCIVGLVIGLLRFSPRATFRLRDGAHSPYSGLMRWHHYFGLAFGVVTLTWVFSGLMSMGPWGWLSSGPVTIEQRAAVTGSLTEGTIGVSQIAAAVAAIRPDFPPRELTLTAFRGELYWMSDAPVDPAAPRPRSRFEAAPHLHRIVSAAQPERGAVERFDAAAIERVARDAMPNTAMVETTWLSEYDDYYYDRRGERPLPVLRVRYQDPDRTWLYFDPRRGAIALKSSTGSRVNRWLYHGLHSLDLPALYYRRPLWDLVVIVLSIGGIVLGALSLVPIWRRLRRHAVRATRLVG